MNSILKGSSVLTSALFMLVLTGFYGSALAVDITVAGSTTVQPLAELLAESYESFTDGVTIIVQGGGSSVGVKSAANGTADIGMASREVKNSEFEEYPGLVVHTIARDGIAIVIHPGSGVPSLSLEQVRGIFSGEITNWNEIGGENSPVIVVSREEGSGTRAAFEDMVMDDALICLEAILQPSNGAVRTTVSITPSSIAYLSFGYLDNSVAPVTIDGVAPTVANATDGSYPVVRPLNMITLGQPSEAAAGWLDFILGEDGQAIVISEGYLPIN